jgi:hypothetical protein
MIKAKMNERSENKTCAEVLQWHSYFLKSKMEEEIKQRKWSSMR